MTARFNPSEVEILSASDHVDMRIIHPDGTITARFRSREFITEFIRQLEEARDRVFKVECTDTKS